MNRDPALDVIRGLLLVVMAADHFGEPIIEHLYEVAGYVTAAAGFVFLSGVLVALVHGRRLAPGMRVDSARLYHRAGVIYACHLATVLVVLAVGLVADRADQGWRSHAVEMQAEPLRGLLSAMLMVYQPPMLDILPLYVLMLLVSPLALNRMARGQGGIVQVLSISAALWLLAQTGIGRHFGALLPDALLFRAGGFDYLAWQFIFMLGLAFGFARAHARLPRNPFHPLPVALCLAIVAGLWLLRHGHLTHPWLTLHDNHIRDTMAWLRLINVLSLIYLTCWLVHHLRNAPPAVHTLLHWPGRWLSLLGRHSLQVFTWHLALLYLLIPLRWHYLAGHDTRLWIALALFLASLTVPAWAHQRWQQRTARR